MQGRNISNFMQWFINQFITIGTRIVNYLDNLLLTNNISLLDFIITITIIGIFITIILTLPQNMNKFESRAERKRKEKKND